jgi:GNAT superfamily N-acetyltransferase
MGLVNMQQFIWRGDFTNSELNALHAEAFAHAVEETDWHHQLHSYSLGWVIARAGPALIGFVNLAWDGGAHAFMLDTMVSRQVARTGVGTTLVAVAANGARAAGCQWLHVDFEAELSPFYLQACGFQPTAAGLINL